MSAIGDYIHLTARGYKDPAYANKSGKWASIQYGDAQKIISAREAQLDQYLKTQHSSLVTNLENKLNELLGMFQKNQNDLTQEEKELSESIANALVERLAEEFAGITIDMKKLETGPKLLGKVRTVKITENNVSYNKLLPRIEEIFKNITKALSSYQGRNSTKIQKIEKDLENIAEDFKSFQQMLKSAIDQKAANSPGLSQQALDTYGTKLLKDPQNFNTFSAIVTSLNSVINALKIPSSSKVAGAIGEEFTELAMEQLLGSAINALDETIESSVRTGPNTKTSGYDTKYFRAGTKWEKVLKKGQVTIDSNGFIATMTNDIVQDKADITITTSKANKIGVQVKNYPRYIAEEYGLKMIDGAPFLALVQNENEDNFVNHYINLWVKHNTNKVADPKSIVQSLNKEKQNISRVMTKLLMIKAATGKGVLGGSGVSTEVFVYIDRQGQGKAPRAYVRSMASLINQVLGEDYHFRLPTQIDNTYAESGPQDRIDNILSQLHSFKVKWSISADTVRASKG